MPEQQPLEMKKPALIVRVILLGDQVMESKTLRYTEKELIDKIFNIAPGYPVEWYGADENNEPVFCQVRDSVNILAYMILDFDSYVKHQLKLRQDQGHPRAPTGLVIPR